MDRGERADRHQIVADEKCGGRLPQSEQFIGEDTTALLLEITGAHQLLPHGDPTLGQCIQVATTTLAAGRDLRPTFDQADMLVPFVEQMGYRFKRAAVVVHLDQIGLQFGHAAIHAHDGHPGRGHLDDGGIRVVEGREHDAVHRFGQHHVEVETLFLGVFIRVAEQERVFGGIGGILHPAGNLGIKRVLNIGNDEPNEVGPAVFHAQAAGHTTRAVAEFAQRLLDDRARLRDNLVGFVQHPRDGGDGDFGALRDFLQAGHDRVLFDAAAGLSMRLSAAQSVRRDVQVCVFSHV